MSTAAVSYFFPLNEANLNYGRKKFCRLTDLYKYWHENIYTCTVSLFFKNNFSRCNQENTQKSRKHIKGILKCIEFIFCYITMIAYSIALSRYLTTTRRDKFFFCGFQAHTESNWGSKSIANFYGAENKKIIADRSRENYIDVLSMELTYIEELRTFCSKKIHSLLYLQKQYVICIWKNLLYQISYILLLLRLSSWHLKL